MTLDALAGGSEFRDLVAAAVRLLEERCARGVASPAETLAVVALAEQPDAGDDAAVRAWQPTTEFRAAVRMVVTSTLAYYVGVVEALADEADGDDAGAGVALRLPHTKGIKSSRHGNMRELRVRTRPPIRIFYAFDPRRPAILLIGGHKTHPERFFREYVPRADAIDDEYLSEIRREQVQDRGRTEGGRSR